MAHRDHRRPPGPPGGRLLGNLAAYEADRLQFLLTSRATVGPVVAFDGRTTMLLGPEAARSVLLDREQAFTVDQNFLQEAVTLEYLEEAWQVRTSINGALRRTSVETAAEMAAEELASRLRQLTATDVVDPLPMLEAATAAGTCRYLLGAEGQDELPGLTAELLDSLGVVIGNPLAVSGQAISPARRRIARRHRALRAAVEHQISLRTRHPARYDDLVSTLLLSSDEVVPQRLGHWVMSALLAGHRVPAAAAAWTLWCVARDQDLQSRLASATPLPVASTEAARDQPREVDALSEAVVLESLRLYPPSWITERTSRRPVEIAGYTFGKGHRFLISPYVLHRDEGEWASPDEFRPERWLAPTRPRGIYVPFGLGRRSCPGRQLATVVLNALLLTVTAGWSIVDRGHLPVTADPRTTLLPRGLALTFTARATTPARLAEASAGAT